MKTETKFYSNSARKYLIVSSTENGVPFYANLDEILTSLDTINSEIMYCMFMHIDAILDLQKFDSLKFQPNRDDKFSKAVIIRIS